MSTTEEIRNRIKQIIHKVANIPPERIGDHASLREDLNLDSLSLLEVGVNVDFEFKLGIANLDERMPALATVDSAVALVEELLREKTVSQVAAT
jgi:acyl carrier protein